jgi:hypothetical protein
MLALRAWLSGLWRVARSAWLVVVVYTLLLAATLPLTAKVHYDLPTPSRPFAFEPGAGPIPDFDWLDEVGANKRGLIGALTPMVVGVAAPMQNLDQLLTGDPPMFAVLVSGAMLVVWAWLWGGVLSNLAGRSRKFFIACQQSFNDVIAISAGSVICSVLAYAVLRTILFSSMDLMTSDVTAERTLFVLRLVGTIIIVSAVAAITVIFDYARIAVVVDDVSIRTALRRGVETVRQRKAAVVALVVLSAGSFAGLLAVYGAFEFIPGGSVPTTSRIIVLGQAYIVGRIVLRLWNAAAQIAIYETRLTLEATE